MKTFNPEQIYQQLYNIVGCAMNLYNELGYGYSERIYQECLSILCTESGIPWEREKRLDMYFHHEVLQQKYYADFVCYDQLIVETKAVDKIIPEHRAQLLNYLRITDSPGGVIINFGDKNRLTSEKYIYDPMTTSYNFIRNLEDLKKNQLQWKL